MRTKMIKKKTSRISIRISIVILAVLLLAMATLPVASADEWSYRKPITINGSQVQGTVTNFPVLINITDTDLKDHAQDDGGDIVFTNANNTVRYDHEIEKFVNSTGELVAWVEIDSLSYGSDKDIYMWYGNPNCADQWNIEGTWGTNYKLVQHLNESCASSSCIKDSTANNNDGTPYSDTTLTNLYTSSGKINGADNFDGCDDYVQINYSPELQPARAATLSAWVKFDDLSKTGDSIVSNLETGGFGLYQRYDETTYGPGIQFFVRVGDAYYGANISHTDMSDGTWYHMVGTYDGETVRIFRDGDLKWENDAPSGNIEYSTTPSWMIACDPEDSSCGSGFPFDGSIDEVRISNTARSADWIETSYNNQNDPSAFYNVGEQQDASSVAPVPDLPAIILFGAGLLVIVLYAVPGRRSRR